MSTSKVERILEQARAKQHATQASYVPPDYQAANKVFARQKTALTRAVNSKSPDAVVLACKKAVEEWSGPPFNGAWPDDWSRWQRALDDVLGWGQSVRLEDLA